MECILTWIFGGFWWIFGAKLGWKIDQKSIQNGIEKTIEKRRRLGGVLEASWGVLELSWEVCTCAPACTRVPVAGAQRPPIKDPQEFSGHSKEYKEGKGIQDFIKGVGLCTPCAGTRPGAADIQRAAELRTRHRAYF